MLEAAVAGGLGGRRCRRRAGSPRALDCSLSLLFCFLLVSSVVVFSIHDNSKHVSNQDAVRHNSPYFTATQMGNFSFYLPTL